MQHDRDLAGVVLGHVLGAQAPGQEEVSLQGAALPYATNAVLEENSILWP
jgi:hypothetical protein